MKIRILGLALGCCTLALPAWAANGSDNSNSYISLSAGRSSVPGTCATTYSPDAVCSEKGNVYRIGYGYQFTPILGVQISYGDFGRAEEKGTLATPPPGVPGGGPIPYTWTWHAVGWEIAATGTLHFGNSISLIGKAGLLRANVEQEIIVITTTNEMWHANYHTSNNSISTSIGAQFDLNRDVAFRVQYDRFGKIKLNDTTKSNVSATFASVILKF